MPSSRVLDLLICAHSGCDAPTHRQTSWRMYGGVLFFSQVTYQPMLLQPTFALWHKCAGEESFASYHTCLADEFGLEVDLHVGLQDIHIEAEAAHIPWL